VTFQGPFIATVDVSATVGVGLKLRNFPWSRDDPCYSTKTSSIISLPPVGPSSGVLAASRAAARDSAPPSTKPEMETSSTSRPVYRVQGIPGSCRRVPFVKSLAAALRTEPSSIRVHSFTATISSRGRDDVDSIFRPSTGGIADEILGKGVDSDNPATIRRRNRVPANR
jgi:protein SERAC1